MRIEKKKVVSKFCNLRFFGHTALMYSFQHQGRVLICGAILCALVISINIMFDIVFLSTTVHSDWHILRKGIEMMFVVAAPVDVVNSSVASSSKQERTSNIMSTSGGEMFHDGCVSPAAGISSKCCLRDFIYWDLWATGRIVE